MLAEQLEGNIIFNSIKHHLGYIRSRIEWAVQNEADYLSPILSELLFIGSSTMDLYTGSLLSTEIMLDISNTLRQTGHFEKAAYLEWLQENDGGYQLVEINDGSSWTLRKGDDELKYIHIHPARHAKFSVRVHANALKTAILALIIGRISSSDPCDVSLVNEVRKNMLDLSPIKSVTNDSGIGEVIALLSNENS
ncbi:MAG: hypothetical protein AAFX87_07400 [Bacteroidota bacterium]